MSNPIVLNSVRFLTLLLAQVFVCNNIDLFGFVNPYIYILFLVLYPISGSKWQFMLASFLLGWSVDFFSDSGGVHAAAALTAAYFRPAILRFSFGVSYEYNTIKVKNTPVGSRLTYVTLLTAIHHLVLFSLEVFNIRHIFLILKSTLFSGIFTVVLCMLFMALFSKKS